MISDIKQTLILTKEDLIEEAKKIEKEFWDQHHRMNDKLDWSKKGLIGLRVRVRERGEIPSLEIEWFKMYFVDKKSGGRKMLSRYIRKGKGNAYSIKTFKFIAKDWELEVIEEVEKKVSLIRHCSIHIGKLSKAYEHLNKSHQKFLEVMNESRSEL